MTATSQPSMFHMMNCGLLSTLTGSGAGRQLAECAPFEDKHLRGCLDKIDAGIIELMKKYPGRKKPQIKSGLRGPKYFIELPIVGKNVDAFSLILSTEKLI